MRAKNREPLTPEATAERIARVRTGTVTLTIKDARNRPLQNASVTVRQTNHGFLFGANAFKVDACRTPGDNAAYKRRFD